MLRTFTEAVFFDAALAPMEGLREFENGLASYDGSTILVHAQNIAMTLPLKSRRRSYGTPTDDTQYLTAGAIVRLFEYDDPCVALLRQWRSFKQLNIWRGIGSRMADFLSGDDMAFADRVLIGDALRWISLLGAVGVEKLENNADEFATLLSMPDEGRDALKCFSRIQKAKAAGDLKTLRSQVEILAKGLGGKDTRNGRFYLAALRYLA